MVTLFPEVHVEQISYLIGFLPNRFLSAGLAFNFDDDQQLLDQGIIIYDAFYS